MSIVARPGPVRGPPAAADLAERLTRSVLGPPGTTPGVVTAEWPGTWPRDWPVRRATNTTGPALLDIYP